jgi:ribosomal protein S18 acetylase RimI-like enzyme
LRTTHGVRMHFIGVHEASRRKGVGRALAGALLTTARRRAIFARVHEPLALHSFFVALGAVVTSETIDLGRPIERSASAMLKC